MKKQLPFRIPEICGYGQFTIALGILDCYPTEKTKLWFIQSFIQMMAVISTRKLRFDQEFNDNEFMSCPFLDKYIIPIEFIRKSGWDIVDFLRDMIEKDTYIGFLCDRFYLPFCKYEYRHDHYVHFALMLGMDDDAETVTAMDYFNYKYSIFDIPFSCLREACASEYCRSNQPFEDSILCVHRREAPFFPIMYNPERLVFLTTEYLKGHKDKENDIWRGIAVYDALELYIEDRQLSFPVVQTIYDHKLAMLRRLQILQELNLTEITEDDMYYFKQAAQKALILRNMLLKQMLMEPQASANALERVKNSIHEYKEYDRNTMGRFMTIIK